MNPLDAAIINRSAEALAALRFAADDAGLVTAFWALCLAGALRLAMACAAPGAPAAEENGLPRWLEGGALAAIMVLGAAVRLYGRDALPYWWDELLAVWLAQSDPATQVRSLATPAAPARDFTPPLF